MSTRRYMPWLLSPLRHADNSWHRDNLRSIPVCTYTVGVMLRARQLAMTTTGTTSLCVLCGDHVSVGTNGMLRAWWSCPQCGVHDVCQLYEAYHGGVRGLAILRDALPSACEELTDRIESLTCIEWEWERLEVRDGVRQSGSALIRDYLEYWHARPGVIVPSWYYARDLIAIHLPRLGIYRDPKMYYRVRLRPCADSSLVVGLDRGNETKGALSARARRPGDKR